MSKRKSARRSARKARQRNRKAAARTKVDRRAMTSGDKSFGAAILKSHPHMEWDGKGFSPTPPAPSPRLEVHVTLMPAAYKKLGIEWSGSRKKLNKSHKSDALTDSGCQTCTAGEDFLDDIGCPTSYLVPTSHRIMGITSASLGIIGSALLRIEAGGEVTRQMVHISKNARGLYLSETALKQLKVLKDDFPQPSLTGSGTEEPITAQCCTDEGAPACLERAPACLERAPTPDRPDEIPFEPIPENRVKLERWFINEFAGSSFNTCSHQHLRGMTGVPMKVVRKKLSVDHPKAYTPIPVAFHFKSQVKKDLDRDVRLGIIEPVPQGEVGDWCSRMVITPKASGKPRRTIDFQALNKATLREIHHTPSPFNLVSSIPGNKLKTVLDAWNGFHNLMLDSESKELTTFITEWGRYRYCRGPQGFHGTGDAYTRRFDDITVGEKRYVRCIDDGLLYDENIETAFWHTFDHLKLCGDNGIVFNVDKFKFAAETVEFAGFQVTMDGFGPTQNTIDSIRHYPTPKTVTDIKSWFGLVGFVAYAFSESEIMQPFRNFMQGKHKQFFWDDTMESLFNRAKEEIIRLVKDGVKAFDIKRPTCLITDWCKTGLGFTLVQKHCDCPGESNPNCGGGHWRLVFAGSKTTNDAQSRYSPSEGECLAAAYGLEKCRMYTLGCPNLTLATDHNPLTGILNDRHLGNIANPRLQKLKERTLAFRFRVIHLPGGSKAMKAADALSRNSATSVEPDRVFQDIESVARAYAITRADDIESITWRRVNKVAADDEECAALNQLISDGFTGDKSALPVNLQRYWSMQDELYTVENVPFKGRKMLIPSSLRQQVLEGLHAANQGVTGMLANARSRFFWPGLDAQVRQLRGRCKQCNEQAPSQHEEPPIVLPPPEYPFEQAVMDLFSLEGHTFLAYADRLSGWLEVERLSTNSFRHVCSALLRWFRTYGVPMELASDGGPPFNSHDYKRFLRAWDVNWRLSSAYFPQSNGRAEAAVKSAKRILQGNINPTTGSLDTDGASRAIMNHRNTPSQGTGVPPSVLLFGRMLRDHLPQSDRELRPEWGAIADVRETALAKRAVKPTPCIKGELPSLEVGDCVQVQNQCGNYPKKWFSTGVVTETLPYRQYKVVLDGSRRVSLRNRRFLKKISPISRQGIDPTPDLDGDGDHPPAPVTTPSPATQEEVYHLPCPPMRSSPQRDPPPSGIEDVIASPNPVVGDLGPVIPNISLVRRGTRVRVERKQFQAKLSGKTHE